MFKYLIICVLFTFMFVSGFSQSEPDTLIEKEYADCDSIAFNAANLIMYFYSIQDYDSVQITLDKWQALCGDSEPVIRTRILFSILDSSFSENLYDSTMVDHVLNYLERIETPVPEELFNDYPQYFGYIPIRGEYDFFTQNLADTLLTCSFNNPMELFYSELYANVLADPMREFQLDTIFKSTELSSYYNKRVDKYRNLPEFNLNFSSGIWIPSDNASLLGIHPSIGMQGGIRVQKMVYNLTMSLRFLESQNEYAVLRDGYVDTTSYFLGGYVGLDIERSIAKMKRNEFSVLAGIGYDGFNTIEIDTEDEYSDNDKGYSVNSLNMNFGIGLRHYFRNKSYFSLEGKYNFLNYANQGGTNLSGNSLTVTLAFGRFTNAKKEFYLNQLRYAD